MSVTRILIVDDDPIARQLYSDCLAQSGHQVLTAVDARSAVELIAREPLDVVVTDLVLPDEDGLAVLAQAKRHDPGIEVLVITAVERVDPAVRAIKSGAADYLIKPVPPEVLQLSVSRCLATRQLLAENALLRQHLSLVETGQRLATTLDREHLFPLAARAFAQALGASGAVLLAREPQGDLALAAREGVGETEAAALAAEALPALAEARPASLLLAGVEHRVLYAEAEGELACACLLRGANRDASAWVNASFLARHVALALQNIRRLRAAEDLAFIDDLTGLRNTRYLHLVLDREIVRSKQSGSPFSLLFLDLDRFKDVNDTYGHLVGSRMLVEMASLLKSCVREIDVPVRYGGDEYVLVLLNTDSRGAHRVAERIRNAIASHRFLQRDGLDLPMTVCVGVASFPEHGSDKQQVLDAADRAMYRGKQSTRNAVSVAA